jgi:hypothetical protein
MKKDFQISSGRSARATWRGPSSANWPAPDCSRAANAVTGSCRTSLRGPGWILKFAEQRPAPERMYSLQFDGMVVRLKSIDVASRRGPLPLETKRAADWGAAQFVDDIVRRDQPSHRPCLIRGVEERGRPRSKAASRRRGFANPILPSRIARQSRSRSPQRILVDEGENPGQTIHDSRTGRKRGR